MSRAPRDVPQGPPKDTVALRFFTEIGIIEQLARNQLERRLPDGLKMSQFIVLHHLVRLGGEWSPARLANAFQVTKGAMTNTLQRLEERGLVHVLADPNDGRGKLVRITRSGRNMRKLCVQSTGPLFAGISKELSIEALATVLPVLEQVRGYLDTHRS